MCKQTWKLFKMLLVSPYVITVSAHEYLMKPHMNSSLVGWIHYSILRHETSPFIHPQLHQFAFCRSRRKNWSRYAWPIPVESGLNNLQRAIKHNTNSRSFYASPIDRINSINPPKKKLKLSINLFWKDRGNYSQRKENQALHGTRESI